MPDPIQFDTTTIRRCDGDRTVFQSQQSGSGSGALGDVLASPVAAWNNQGLSQAAMEDMVDLVNFEVEGPAQSNADYWVLVMEAPYVQAAGSTARTDDTSNDKLKLIPLSEFLTTYTGEARSYMFGVRGGAGIDESLTIAAIFEWCLNNGNGSVVTVYIRARKASDPIYLNRVVTLYASNVRVKFLSPVTYGATGGLRMFGDQPEVLRNGKTLKASLRAQAAAGQNILQLSASTPSSKMNALVDPNGDFIAGDTIVLRGQNDVYGKALTKQVVHVTLVDTVNNNLHLAEELEYTFEPTYPASDWVPDHTTGTTIAVAAYASLTQNAPAGASAVRVNRAQYEASGIAAGSMVLVSTDEVEGDININAHSSTPRGTSTTSESIGLGDKTFTMATMSGSFAVGTRIRARSRANQANWVLGRVTAVTGSGVGSTVTISVLRTGGAGGPFTDWTLDKPYSNAARLEWKHVLSATNIDATTTDVTLDSPLVDAYTTARFGGITLYTPITNSTFEGVRATYIADQASRNTHGIQIGFGYRSYIVDCQVDGRGGQKGNGIRISNSLECEAIASSVSNPKFSNSAEGYGFAIYYADRCRTHRCKGEGCRHNILVQKGNHTTISDCLSLNDLISGIDLHGVRSFNTHIKGCRLIGGPGISAELADNKSALRVGNTSHACGDYNTLIEGCFVSGCLATIVVTGDIESGSATVSNINTTGMRVGQVINGAGILSSPPTTILALTATAVTMSQNAVSTAVGIAITVNRFASYAALELYGRSSDIVMQNCLVADCSTGIRAGFDNFRQAPDSELDQFLNVFEQNNRWIRVGLTPDSNNDFLKVAAEYGDSEIMIGGRKVVAGNATTDLSISTTLPIDGSVPLNTEGVEVLSTVYTPCAPKIKLTFVIPVIETSASVAVVAAVFIDGVFSFAWAHRVTSGATPPDGIIASKVISIAAGARTISVRVGPHSAATLTLNPTGNNWGDNTRVAPFLMIEEG